MLEKQQAFARGYLKIFERSAQAWIADCHISTRYAAGSVPETRSKLSPSRSQCLAFLGGAARDNSLWNHGFRAAPCAKSCRSAVF
jgi:hypothetical protein